MRRPPPSPLLHRFARDERGSYAVEFSIVSGVFITTVVCLFQFLLVFMARDSLEATLQAASRNLLTGTFQQDNAGTKDPAQVLTNLKALMCGSAATPSAVVFNCSDMKVDVSVTSSFSGSASNGSAVDSGSGGWSSDFGTNYTCPSAGSIAVVRVAVKFPIIARGLAFGLSDFSDGSILLQSAAAFRVEQYQSGKGSAC